MEVINMPELRCPECGNKLLPGTTTGVGGSPCVCSACGRKVYAGEKITAEVKCATCGEINKKEVVT
jgi:DNA-directed RNA polymerase subunit RPC12/RpoP